MELRKVSAIPQLFLFQPKWLALRPVHNVARAGRKGVTDILGELGLLRDAWQRDFQPMLDRGDDRDCVLASVAGVWPRTAFPI